MAPSPMPCKKVPLMDKSSSPNETIPGDASGLGRRKDLYERVFELSVATRSITYFCKDDTRTLPLASIRIVPPNFELVCARTTKYGSPSHTLNVLPFWLDVCFFSAVLPADAVAASSADVTLGREDTHSISRSMGRECPETTFIMYH